MTSRALTLALSFAFGLTLVACDKKEEKKADDKKADDKKADDKKADDQKDGGAEKADGGW